MRVRHEKKWGETYRNSHGFILLKELRKQANYFTVCDRICRPSDKQKEKRARTHTQPLYSYELESQDGVWKSFFSLNTPIHAVRNRREKT